MKLKQLFVSALLAGLFGAASAATTPAGYCGAGGTISGTLDVGNTQEAYTLNVSDMTYRGSAANDCYGAVTGNDVASDLNGLFGNTSYSFLTRYNAGSSGGSTTSQVFNVTGGSLTFDLEYLGLVGGLHAYHLGATAAPSSLLPATLDLVGVIKQGTYWAAYEFEDVRVDTSPDINGTNLNVGTFYTSFGPGINDFSHFGFYGTNYTPCTDPTSPNCVRDPSEDPIPEPGTIALAGLGLLAAAVARRRRRA